ncbi:MAG: hypothetical protein OXN22_11575 [Deltaproteobacteria bacterium]|nr:hypothetical protein [Deltaproteobacteria bacterium]
MIRQTMRSLALAAVGLALAGGAWGQVLRQATNPAFMVAAEYFGASAGREIQSSKFGPPGVTETPTDLPVRPYVSLTVSGDTAAATPSITGGNTADITFTLGGATFSETVAPANLDRRNGGCDTEAKQDLQVALQSGGARGDHSATFRVTAPDAGLASGNIICFWVPNVQATLVTVSAPGVMPAVSGVTVTASITQGVTNNNPFPTVISGDNVDAAGMPTGDSNASGTPGGITDRTVFTAAPALTTSLGEGGMALVALADRTKIASGGVADPSAMDPATATMGLSVGSLSIAPAANAAMIWKLDGSGAVATASTDGGAVDTLDATLGGQVMLSVGGPFQAGDKVVFGSGATARSVSPSGGTAGTAVELKPVTDMGIVYVPGGTGTLTPSTFAAGAMYSFNSLDNNNNLPIMMSTGRIDYDGITVQAYAYGVVRGGGTEQSVIRATCNAPSGMCQVFADCTGQDGESYFGGPVPIPAGATGRVDSDDIALALGGGWDSGRGSCDIYSTHDLAVQHMVRTGTGLINNSAVVGRDLDEDTSAIDAIKMVVDDICDSVGQGDPATVDDAEVDTVCQPVDTTPEP